MGILQSLLIGFSVAAIPGAIFFEVIRRTLTRGFWSGVLLALGEFIGHVLLLTLIFLGVSTFLQNPLITMILYGLGSAIMLWLSYKAFRVDREQLEARHAAGRSDSLLIGFGISITDPFIVALWFSLSGSYLSQFATSAAILNILAISLGFLGFFLPVATITHYSKKRIPMSWTLWFSRIAGLVLLLSALLLLYSLLNLLA